MCEVKQLRRNRDITVNSEKNKFIYDRYKSIAESDSVGFFSRVFHSIPEKKTAVSLNTDSLTDIPNAKDAKTLLHLGSYNYSGLNGHPEILQAAKEALFSHGTTSSGVRLLNGTTNLHLELEARLARFLNMQDCVTFSSGYAANLAVLNTLCDPTDYILTDMLNHNSIVEGIRMTGCKTITYRHANPANLAKALRKLPLEARKFIITDGIFSMDGDLAPLPEISDLADEYNAFLIVDDAHGTSAIGKCGRGSVDHFDLTDRVDVITGSLSKGLPGIGGFVATSKKIASILRSGASQYIFSASIPPVIAAALIKAIDLLDNNPSIQQRVQSNAHLMKGILSEYGFNMGSSVTPIIPIMIGDEERTIELTRRLHEDGIYVNLVIYPAVSKSRARLRINVSAAFSQEEIVECCQKLCKHAKDLNII